MRVRSPAIPPSQITPEGAFRRRRDVLKGFAAAVPALLMGCSRDSGADAVPSAPASTQGVAAVDIAKRGQFAATDVQTRYEDATHYNNYYEFGTGKGDPAQNSSRFKPAPWTVEVAGNAEVTGTFALEDFLKPHPLEERIYRMRCVEAWSMVIPWVGVPLGDVLKRFKPTSRAKYVAFTTVNRPAQMPGMSYAVLDWPSREGLRIDEAMHPLTLLAVGMYGHALPNQNGAPLRLVVPWKYGYKGIKSIVRIEFTERQPPTSWNMSAPNEYGFYSNVNPAVDHPRWSQSSERRIAGSGLALLGNRVKTLPFNGYADQVASLYAGMDLRKEF